MATIQNVRLSRNQPLQYRVTGTLKRMRWLANGIHSMHYVRNRWQIEEKETALRKLFNDLLELLQPVERFSIDKIPESSEVCYSVLQLMSCLHKRRHWRIVFQGQSGVIDLHLSWGRQRIWIENPFPESISGDK